MIQLEQLHVKAGAFELRDVSVVIPRGAWAIVLGPAGAGKTTLLETVAGVRRVSSGRVLLRGVDATSVPPERRGAAIVYQQGLLFPHLSVDANIRYGASDASHASALAARFGADAMRDRPVRSLSGGEAQIVALVRALARRPDILLLDEPFAALDARRRTRVRRELMALRREENLTVLQVTHDFAEAGTLGDLALLMDSGRLVQVAAPATLFRQPATPAAAEFLGAENVYAGTISRGGEGNSAPDEPAVLLFRSDRLTLSAIGTASTGPAHAVIRGEDVALSRDSLLHGSARNVLQGTVVEVEVAGVIARVTLDVDGTPLVSVITSAAAAELGLATGIRVHASVKATAIHLC